MFKTGDLSQTTERLGRLSKDLELAFQDGRRVKEIARLAAVLEQELVDAPSDAVREVPRNLLSHLRDNDRAEPIRVTLALLLGRVGDGETLVALAQILKENGTSESAYAIALGAAMQTQVRREGLEKKKDVWLGILISNHFEDVYCQFRLRYLKEEYGLDSEPSSDSKDHCLDPVLAFLNSVHKIQFPAITAAVIAELRRTSDGEHSLQLFDYLDSHNPAVVKCLRFLAQQGDASGQAQMRIAKGLEASGSVDALEPLTGMTFRALCNGASPHLRECLLQAIQRTDDSGKALESLGYLYGGIADEEAREAIVSRIAGMTEPAAMQELTRLFSASMPARHLIVAIDSLGYLPEDGRNKSYFEHRGDFLRLTGVHDDPRVRLATISCLARLRSPGWRAVVELRAGNDPDAEVRDRCRLILEKE